MICIHCRLELSIPAEVRDDMKVWVDLIHGEPTCPPPTVIPPGALLSVTSHTPAYEVSGSLLDDIVEDLACAAEMADGIGETEVAEMLAQLAEQASIEPKPVES